MSNKAKLLITLLLLLTLLIAGCAKDSGDVKALSEKLEQVQKELDQVKEKVETYESRIVALEAKGSFGETPPEGIPETTPQKPAEISEKYKDIAKALEKHNFVMMESDDALIAENDNALVQYYLEDSTEKAKSFFNALVATTPEGITLDKKKDEDNHKIYDSKTDDGYVTVVFKDKSVVMIVSLKGEEGAKEIVKDLGLE